MRVKLALATLLSVAGINTPAHAALLGTSLTGSLTALRPGFQVSKQFNNTAIVGNDVEFTGSLFDKAFAQQFDVLVDVSDYVTKLYFTSPINGSNLSSPFEQFEVKLGSSGGLLPGIGSTDFACGSDCSNPSGLKSIASDGNALTLRFNRVRAGDTYTINFVSGVPEPATWAMLVGGFGMIGTALRRRNRQRASLA